MTASAHAPSMSRADSAFHTLIGSTGQTLAQLSNGNRVLVVFLRHSGCTFCREALDDLSKVRAKIEARGSKIALVHMSPEDDIRPFVEKYHVADLPRFSDPQRQLYTEFDLQPARLSQLFGLKVLWRGMLSALHAGHGFGRVKESVSQMPGTFLIENGQVLRAFRHQSPADRPDYAELACPVPSRGLTE
jgi:peroxiredoxin